MKKILRVLTNKFLLTLLAFLAWMTYFDQNDWISQNERKQELKNVKEHIAYLNEEIARMEKEKEGMSSDPKVLEQYAREQYRMKRDDEDLYLVEKK